MDKTLFHTLKGLNASRNSLDNAYVFCNINSRPYRDIRWSFEIALRKAGIADFRFHDMRYTFASYLVMSGVDLKTVQELLGHKTIHMTPRYSHLSPAHKRVAVEMVDSRLHNPMVEPSENWMDTNMDTRSTPVEGAFT